MYLGRVVESGPTPELFAAPNHPYTQALLAEAGKVEPGKRTFVPIKGEIPSPLAPPPGCHFHPRCPQRDGDLPDDGARAARDRARPLVVLSPERRRERQRPQRRRSGARSSRHGAPAMPMRRGGPLVARFAAFGRALSGRFRPRPAARDRAARRGHPRRAPYRARAPRSGATLIEATFPARVHRREPQPRRSRSGAARRAVARSRSRRRARPSRASASSGASRADGAPMYGAQAHGRRGAASHRGLLPAVPRGAVAAELDDAASRVRRRLAHQLPFDAGGRRCERRRSGARARRFRARRSRRHDVRARISRRRRATSPRARVTRSPINDPVQGRRNRAAGTAGRVRRHSLQIEINRRLYMDEATLEPNARYANLEADLGRLLAAASGASFAPRLVRPLDRFVRRCHTPPHRRTAPLPATAAYCASDRSLHGGIMTKFSPRNRRRRSAPCCSPRQGRPRIRSGRSR